MNTPQQIAKHFREIHFGGNWTCSNLKDNLSKVTWKQATTKIDSFNTIATLAFHVNYFVSAVLKVLQGEALNANDKYSFDHPPISKKEDWDSFLDKMWSDAEQFANLVEQLSESKLQEIFTDEKYGTYYRNLNGIIEHSHYHLGQIVILHKLVSKGS
ncbi:MAG: DinB family protein [Bacteroidia bacterium]|nr:DinB family protein [Bacteroidia bacterium]